MTGRNVRSRLKELFGVYIVPLLPGSIGLEYFRGGTARAETLINNREIENFRKSRVGKPTSPFKKWDNMFNAMPSLLSAIAGGYGDYATYLPLVNATFEAFRDEGSLVVAAAYVGLSAVIRYPLYYAFLVAKVNLVNKLEDSREELSCLRR